MSKKLIDLALGAYSLYSSPKFFIAKLIWDQLPDDAFVDVTNLAMIKTAEGLYYVYKNGSWILQDLGNVSMYHVFSINRYLTHQRL
jgi:hypothetical protein